MFAKARLKCPFITLGAPASFVHKLTRDTGFSFHSIQLHLVSMVTVVHGSIHAYRADNRAMVLTRSIQVAASATRRAAVETPMESIIALHVCATESGCPCRVTPFEIPEDSHEIDDTSSGTSLPPVLPTAAPLNHRVG
jgi:hypothetical protein